ncbi:hypothetical protein PTKIN_Ptkin14bG0017800 [Pterospermum kingtungense]
MSSIDPNVLMNLSSSLRSLSLNNCGLQGKFPEILFHLLNLKLLNLGDNVNLSLSLPKFNQSSHLEFLDLSATTFSKELFDSIGKLLLLEHLDASRPVSYQGELPHSIRNLVSLKHLDLQRALISGSILEELGNLSKLNYLDLSFNHFHGRIPSSLFRSHSQLEFLNLGYNQLEGSILDEVSPFPNLSHLDLSLNLFNGTLPSWLYTIPSLNYIYLHDNQFSGHIKDFQCNSSQVIWLQNNKLQGLEKFSWTGIEYLDLSSNLIRGDLPIPSWTTYVFSISNNSLSGGIASQLCDMIYLGVLDLSHNNMSGIIPECFGNLSKTVWLLNLEKNKFGGTIPTLLMGYGLMNLNLKGNQFEGPLSRSILNCSSLEVLDLGDNRINDTCPHWLGSLLQLQVLVLRSNLLHGSIHDNRSNPSSKSKFFTSQVIIFLEHYL